MIIIQNKKDLKIVYLLVSVLKNQETIKECKRAIREYTHKNESPDRHLVKDYGIDGYIELIELPKYLETEEKAKEYFKEYEYIIFTSSWYDCTKKSFTKWFKICKRGNRFYAYHSIGIDI